jgi:hypothetical protein
MPFVRFTLLVEPSGQDHFMITRFQVEHKRSVGLLAQLVRQA